MATVTLTSARSASILQNLDYEKAAHLRDASFSSYLNGGEDNSKLKRADSTPQEPTYQQVSSGRKNGYGEISVFGAEKYFNGVMDEKETISADKKDGGVPVHDMQRKTRGTPSTTSEASWNSRSALLPITQSRQDKPNGKKFFAAMGCNCYCADKQSVDVDENISEKPSFHSKKNTDSGEIHGKVATKLPTETKHDSVGPAQIKKTPSASWTKEDIPSGKLDKGDNGVDSQVCFSLPMSNSSVENLSLQSKLEQVEIARRSLEVFGSPIMDREEIELSIEKRLAMLTWDANPRVEKTTNVPIVESRLNDDIDSDSSSDLFEIKSLSSNGHPFFKRQPSGGMSDCMSPSSIYEPSEASIDWSVVTASAANFSVVSDYEEPVPKDNSKKRDNTKTIAKTAPISTKTETSKDNAKRRPSMLLGCRSHKSVKVIGGAHKLPEKKPEFRGQHKLYSVTPRSRFQPEIKGTDLDSAHAQRAFAMGSQLQSARKPDPVYKL